jgi:hypothetical protein
MRFEPRYSIFQIGVIESKNSRLYVSVCDFSDNGVRVNTTHDVPDEFFLKYPGLTMPWAGHYRVVWRRNGEFGAERLNSETKPAAVFGRQINRTSEEFTR